jgi:Na+-driven multidrug efflux pump
MACMGLAFYVLPKYIMMVFTTDKDVISSGIQVLRILAFFQPFDALQIVLGLALRGAADTRWVMTFNLANTWLVFVPGSYLLAVILGLGLKGSWWGLGFFLFIAGMAMTLRFRSGRWKTMEI